MKASNNIGHGEFFRLFGLLLLLDLIGTMVILRFGASLSLMVAKYVVLGGGLFGYIHRGHLVMVKPAVWRKLHHEMDYNNFLERINQILVSDLNFQQVFEKFQSELQSEIPFDYALIYRVEEEYKKFAPYICGNGEMVCSLNQHFELMKEEFWQELLVCHQPVLMTDPEKIKVVDELADKEVSSIIMVPMVYQNQVHGFLLLASEEAGSYQALNLNFLKPVAERLMISMENCILYQQTKDLSLKDYLTGCPNRRALDLQLDYEYRRAKRYHESFSILVLDIDHFKKVNDCYGHLAGDQILQELAQIMRDAVRDIDMVSRFGGEEFVILLPETNAEHATVVAERIRQQVAEYEFILIDGRQVQVTVSVGVASYTEEMDGIQELLKGADLKLYSAKECGRNQVVHLTPTA